MFKFKEVDNCDNKKDVNEVVDNHTDDVESSSYLFESLMKYFDEIDGKESV